MGGPWELEHGLGAGARGAADRRPAAVAAHAAFDRLGASPAVGRDRRRVEALPPVADEDRHEQVVGLGGVGDRRRAGPLRRVHSGFAGGGEDHGDTRQDEEHPADRPEGGVCRVRFAR
ncbi:MAG: hypothetical protein M0Z69_01130 [Actinomycetota bacterium]|nr:hypothetical protein [Actinomycetota bacterium]